MIGLIFEIGKIEIVRLRDNFQYFLSRKWMVFAAFHDLLSLQSTAIQRRNGHSSKLFIIKGICKKNATDIPSNISKSTNDRLNL